MALRLFCFSRSRTALFVFTLAFAAVASADDAKRDDDLLQGTWELVSAQSDGKNISQQDLNRVRMVFDGDRYEVKYRNDIRESGTFKLDPGKNPKTIDVKILKGPFEGKTQLGIYALDGEMLKTCFAYPGVKDRPKEFEQTEGESHLFELNKEKN